MRAPLSILSIATTLLSAVVGVGAMSSAGAVEVRQPQAADLVAAPTKVLTFIEENHSYTQMKDQMPYLFGLAQRYGYATNWYAIQHPSLPNYLAIVGGSTFSVTDDLAPSINSIAAAEGPSVFDQAIASGRTAKLYAESMPSNCSLVSAGDYAVKHNPWAYFSASRTRCGMFNVPTGTPTAGPLLSDTSRNTLPNVGMVIPNLVNDAHNASLGTADSWLKGWLPKILASSDFTSGQLVVVITADEDDRNATNNVLTVVLHASLSGKVVTTRLTHYSLTRFYAQVLGMRPLKNGSTAPDMRAAFGL